MPKQSWDDVTVGSKFLPLKNYLCMSSGPTSMAAFQKIQFKYYLYLYNLPYMSDQDGRLCRVKFISVWISADLLMYQSGKSEILAEVSLTLHGLPPWEGIRVRFFCGTLAFYLLMYFQFVLGFAFLLCQAVLVTVLILQAQSKPPP